jgi:uncharacterized repeat protein (TIGR03803 family)
MRTMKSHWFLAPFFSALLLTCVFPTASAQTYRVLHTFAGAQKKDGAYPQGTPILDAAGNVYGTTQQGGALCGNFTCGTIFMVNTKGAELVFRFNGQNGMWPSAGLFRDSRGNLYGTTMFGGAHNNCLINPRGCGTIFQLNSKGTNIHYYSFAGQPDGGLSQSPLVEVSGGFYGTTYEGGAFDYGTVFKIDVQGHESAIYNFQGQSDGCLPYTGLTADSKGNLYGVTSSPSCGNGTGNVYELDTAGNFTVLYVFDGIVGSQPNSRMILDSEGNLYGTTSSGGANGQGTIFELSPGNNGSWSAKALYSFCSAACPDGAQPRGPLVRDNAGNLYGVAYGGGTYGLGTVFKLDTSGTLTVLHTFTGHSDGYQPVGGLAMDASGNLYGVTLSGGNFKCNSSAGCGVVFELTPQFALGDGCHKTFPPVCDE